LLGDKKTFWVCKLLLFYLLGKNNKINNQNPKGKYNMAIKQNKKQVKISNIEITKDKLSARGGLFFFLR